MLCLFIAIYTLVQPIVIALIVIFSLYIIWFSFSIKQKRNFIVNNHHIRVSAFIVILVIPVAESFKISIEYGNLRIYINYTPF